MKVVSEVGELIDRNWVAAFKVQKQIGIILFVVCLLNRTDLLLPLNPMRFTSQH